MKVKAIELDETEYYDIDSKDRPYIKAIMGVYYYNADEATYCCELTPSYDLRYLYTSLVFSDDTSDDDRDRLDDKYAHCPSDDCYMHCSGIDRIAKQFEYEFEDMDEALDYLSGNCPF